MGNRVTLASLYSFYSYTQLYEDGEIKKTRLMYGWSKYGGGTHGLVQTQSDVWYCQSCKDELRKEVPSFMMEYSFGEFARICSSCQDIARRSGLKDLMSLAKAVRRKHDIFD